jgi:hypothetical protein
VEYVQALNQQHEAVISMTASLTIVEILRDMEKQYSWSYKDWLNNGSKIKEPRVIWSKQDWLVNRRYFNRSAYLLSYSQMRRAAPNMWSVLLGTDCRGKSGQKEVEQMIAYFKDRKRHEMGYRKDMW